MTQYTHHVQHCSKIPIVFSSLFPATICPLTSLGNSFSSANLSHLRSLSNPNSPATGIPLVVRWPASHRSHVSLRPHTTRSSHRKIYHHRHTTTLCHHHHAYLISSPSGISSAVLSSHHHNHQFILLRRTYKQPPILLPLESQPPYLLLLLGFHNHHHAFLFSGDLGRRRCVTERGEER